MQPTLTLSVFGSPCIQTNTKENSLTAPLPVLIASYVVIEHQGEAQNREDVCHLFYPIDFEAPSTFEPLTQNLYQHFWRMLTEAQTETTSLFVRDEILQGKEEKMPSSKVIQNAHQQLLDYAIIEKVEQTEGGWRYYPNKQLIKYLNKTEDAKNGKNKIELTKKTFSAHIGNIREYVKKVVGEKQWQAIVPTGKTGQKSSATSLVICIPSNAEQLKQALSKSEPNFEIIQKIYTGPFLDNIEKNTQNDGKWFFPPELRAWVLSKRTEFAEFVSNALIDIVRQADSMEALNAIQNYSEQCSINSAELVQALEDARKKCAQSKAYDNKPITPSELVPIVISPNNDNAHLLPRYLRTHLLNKTCEECEAKLQTTHNKWMETYLTVHRKERWSETGLNVRSPKLLMLLFEKSYGFAVLLGEAGMGKSIGLCYLAQMLGKQAEINFEKPVPLLLHLADWAQKAWSFEDWLKFQLVRLGLAEKHIDNELNRLMTYQQCVLLLDGFDNLPPIQRPLYLQHINNFIRKYGEAHLGGVILASRTEEYSIAKEQYSIISQQDTVFHFQTEATLLPLKQAYTYQYLTAHTSIPPHLTEKLLEMEGLREFLNIPLGLTLFIHNTQNQFIEIQNQPNDNTSHDIKSTLIENYVEKQFEEVSQPPLIPNEFPSYSSQQTRNWLGHIARYLNMGDTFHLENLTPEILNPMQQKKYRTLFFVFFSVIFGLMMGGVAGLIFGNRVARQIADTPPLNSSLSNTLNFWIEHNNLVELILVYSCIGMLTALLITFISLLLFKRIHFPFFLSGYLAFFMGLTGWLVDGSQWSVFSTMFYGTLGIVLGIVIDPIHTNPNIISLNKDIRFRRERIFKQLYNSPYSLLFIPISIAFMICLSFLIKNLSMSWAILNGLTIGLSFTLGHLIYRSKYDDNWHKKVFYSKQKLDATLKRSLTMILLVGGGVTVLVTILSSPNLGWPGNLSLALRVGMPLGIAFGFISYGGVEVLKHYVLRWVMYQEGIAPANYTAFLEYAKKLGFLRSQSGGYVFQHDWFQEYFAQR